MHGTAGQDPSLNGLYSQIDAGWVDFRYCKGIKDFVFEALLQKVETLKLMGFLLH